MLNVYSGTCLPSFIEISSYLTNTEQKNMLARFLDTSFTIHIQTLHLINCTLYVTVLITSQFLHTLSTQTNNTVLLHMTCNYIEIHEQTDWLTQQNGSLQTKSLHWHPQSTITAPLDRQINILPLCLISFFFKKVLFSVLFVKH